MNRELMELLIGYNAEQRAEALEKARWKLASARTDPRAPRGAAALLEEEIVFLEGLLSA